MNLLNAADFLSERARLTPNRIALVDLHTGERHSYRALNARANRAARFLQRLGIGKGDRVSLLAYNSIHTFDLFFACGKIGAIFAPFNWRLKAPELLYIAHDLEPKVLVVGPECSELVAAMRPDIPDIELISIEDADVPGAWHYEQEIATESEDEPERPPVEADDPYCILYTSGTTGHPKGAMIPHRQILWNAINTVMSWGLTENDISPIFTPLFHAGGLFAFMTPLLYVGGRLVMARTFDAEASLQAIIDEKCTVILGVPTLFQMWRQSPTYASADFSHVHFFISGGAPCPVDLMDAWRREKDIIFRQGYGLTEVGPNCFSMTDEESAPKSGTVGKPLMNTRMRLVDPESKQSLPPHQAGELWISGPHVCLGYWRNPAATAEVLLPSDDPTWPWPWFRTGDMAVRDDDGFYTIKGRFKDMIISGGENIYAAEVENVLRQHPAVADCALIGKPDEKWGEVGLMVVVLEAGAQATSEELRAFCAEHLARYKAPKEIVFTDALPYSAYGKVLKPVLKKMFVG